MAKAKSMTLKAAVEEYLAYLEQEGKAEPTVRSYKGDYEMLITQFGEKKFLVKIPAAQMGKFLKSKPVTKMKSGKAKAQASVDKTRRAIRHFLAWCVEEGYLTKSPFPGK